MKGSAVQGKILVVDAISTNRIVLKVKLSGAFYQVLQAASIEEAVRMIRFDSLDMIITATALPDGTAADLARRVQAAPQHRHLPILAVGTPASHDDRLEILAAGVSDVMARPIDDIMLLGRVRSLMRAHTALAEFQMWDDSGRALGLAEPEADFARQSHIMLVGDDTAALNTWGRGLHRAISCRVTVTPTREAMAVLHAGPPTDALVLALPKEDATSESSLRLISALRASPVTRHIGLLAVQQVADSQRATTALDLGANDIMCNGFDCAEMVLRLKVLLRSKTQMERLHKDVKTGLREVVHDPLTGIYNRRYAMPFLRQLCETSGKRQRGFAVIVCDMDHFKQVNDVYGHVSGDAVLVEAARRLQQTLRGIDILARIGGEEFLAVLPGADEQTASRIAERLRLRIEETGFIIPRARGKIRVTMSFGIALSDGDNVRQATVAQRVEDILDRADRALYRAKMKGRNRIGLNAPTRRPAA